MKVCFRRAAGLFPRRGLRVSPSFFMTLAAALLLAPPRLTAAVLLAAAAHEGGHLAALAAFHAPVVELRLGAFGAVIRARTERLSYGRELLAALAGPAVNLLAAPLTARLAARCAGDWWWLLAGAHTVLGVYNLLPIPPLDGGRALYLMTAYFAGPDAGDRVSAAVGLAAALGLCACGAYLALHRGGALLLLAALGLLLGACREARLPPKR